MLKMSIFSMLDSEVPADDTHAQRPVASQSLQMAVPKPRRPPLQRVLRVARDHELAMIAAAALGLVNK